MLTEARIEGMAEGLRQVAALEDPIGEVTGMKKRPNGLMIGQKRVPLGVIGIIYEARPNVTADAFALCFKTGNVVILKRRKRCHPFQYCHCGLYPQCPESPGSYRECHPADPGHFQRDHRRVYENERVRGCTDSKRRPGTDQGGCKRQHHPGNRDRYRQLSHLCG